ncbi:MAG TPA: acetolactate synthase large subunit [Halieaceae bacterium]|jgi:acetolactate synthase-1/2/3 large subunit|uniref:acetolactate synthase large subunit n=1 Tax=Haliea TaxID=475794 RepID=UPI000C457E04|nr:acetolactate synthase large subunit [Haliea sp.]HBM82346.1 acetolactate synthase large subunit [Halieaceae bacterium]MAD64593.1 acetolactate synthase large subunit [Haliea sp.]MAY93091.1 acetolactate synthase large subunit [Haliea sp.]MBK39706.1 acetolactate synthase large subunit [Haliea sp.]MBP69501.1 acetolactate synthase large subunit [Haliea sp.]|tara:strand:+ start:29453 stop:31018 length:1566 start_codon:yes stop_codon:yes gene_type:complete
MNGAESLITTLVNNGVTMCFTNPGTSEMHFVAALDEVEGMRCVLCLFEGVVTGAADGFARIAERPAATLLHLGPGLGNGLANVHNAKKGHVPMINVVGDHATYHLQYDAPLTSDIEGIARPVSHWVLTSSEPADIARDAAEAVRQAGHDQVATLVLPADVSWGDNPNGAAPAVAIPGPAPVPAERLQRAVTLLGNGKRTGILLGGRHISDTQTLLLSRIGRASGARVLAETFPARVRRGAGTGVLERLPYLAELAIDSLKDLEQLILVGADSPVSFFAYPDVASVIPPAGCDELLLAAPGEDIEQALEFLLEALDAVDVSPDTYPLQVPDLPSGALDANSVAQALAHYLPENAVVVDEGITSGLACFPLTANARPHDWLNQTGGAIGWGLPAAVGAALAAPERKVICLEGDGSAMYTVQALWTMAREQLDVTVVIFNNRKYSILELEFARTGARGGKPGPKAASSLDIGSPDMDFVAMARGMGVAASCATTAEEFNTQLEAALASGGPSLIDARVPPLQLG